MSNADKLYDVAGEVLHETDKAWKFDAGTGEEIWLPKSQCEWDPLSQTMTMPEWLARAKGLF